MKSVIAKTAAVMMFAALVACGGSEPAAPEAEEAATTGNPEYPDVTDVGVDTGQSQDDPAAAGDPNGPAPVVTDEPTDDGGSQDDLSAAGKQ